MLLAVYSSDPSRIVAGDTASYENPARALLAVGRFVSSPEEPARVEMLRTPGYPAFIAAVYGVSRHSRLAVAIAQIAISTATLALTFLLALRLWDISFAWTAAVVLALDPLSFVYAPLLQSETLFALAVVLLALAGMAWMRTGAGRHGFFFGLAAACATLIRPIAYYLFLPALVFICARQIFAGRPLRRVVAAALLAALPWMVLVEGWRVRNYVLTGRLEIAQIASVNLAWYRGAGIIATRDRISFWDAREKMARSLPDTTGWSPGAVSALYEREGLELILAHPALFARNEAFGLLKILGGPGRADLLHYFAGVPYEETPEGAVEVSASSLRQRFSSGGGLATIPVAYGTGYLLALYAYLLFALWAIWRHERPWWVEHAFLWLIVAYLVVMAAGPEAYARFRVPVMPFLAMYAARGWNAASHG